MTFKKYGLVLGLVLALALTGCQTGVETPVNEPDQATEETQDQDNHEDNEEEHEDEEGHTEDDHDHDDDGDHEALDLSNGFKMPEQALDFYMEEIVHKDFDIAYKALHQLDKDAFELEDFVAYQKAFQSARDIHGYAIHEEQSFKMFDFGGLTFEEVIFYDLDYAYVDVGEEPPEKSEDQDHGHDHSSDYTSHDHGHNMATMGLAVVKRNGNWYVLQGQSQYELQDLTRKYTNQGVSLNLEDKASYSIGDSVSVGNMIFAVNSIMKNDQEDAYILEVVLMNAGFDPLNTSHFVSKFAVKDSNTDNFMSVASEGLNALEGMVRAGSFIKGEILIPIKNGFEADAVYFLMNTIDPSKPPVRIGLDEVHDNRTMDIYNKMVRKPSIKIGQIAQIEGLSLEVKGATRKASDQHEGFDLLALDLEIKNTAENKLYLNQVDLTVRAASGLAKRAGDQLQTENLDSGQGLRETVQVLMRQDAPAELTLHLNSQTPNNNVTVELD